MGQARSLPRSTSAGPGSCGGSDRSVSFCRENPQVVDLRWVAVSEFRALNGAWLRLSQNDATGDGGTCFGDSGGPNFLGAGNDETKPTSGWPP